MPESPRWEQRELSHESAASPILDRILGTGGTFRCDIGSFEKATTSIAVTKDNLDGERYFVRLEKTDGPDSGLYYDFSLDENRGLLLGDDGKIVRLQPNELSLLMTLAVEQP
jgi:hypothetical protein